MSLLESALHYAAMGWRILPVNPLIKVPAIKEWQTKATRDPDQITAWWSANPHYNVGALCGPDIVVVDIDVKDGTPGVESLSRILGEHGEMPPTLTHRTPSGGWHYIFRCPGDWNIRPLAPISPAYPGVDLRTGMSQILLPPSRTESGERTSDGNYSVEFDAPMADAPAWINLVVSAPRARLTAHGGSRLTPVGERNGRLTRLAGTMRRGGQDEAGIFNRLWEINTAWSSPLAEEEVRTIARSAMRWQPKPLGGVWVEYASRTLVTDQTLARWLVRCCNGNARWVYDQNEWIVWNGVRWSRNSAALGFMQAAAREEVREEAFRLREILNNEPADTKGKDTVEPYIDSAMVIHRGLEMVKGQAAAWLASQQEAEVPVATDELDADPYLLNCENGILDLRTGRLRPHNRDDMMTYLAPTVYDAEADMTDWIEFVEWACQGDQEQVRWLQIMLGQALIGKVETHTMLFFYGPGANGKTQLTDAIGLTIGDYGASAPVELITARGKDQLHTESMASIRGRRFIVCPEPEKNAHWNDGRLKRLTGGDVVKARHLYGREFEFKPQCLLVVHGNHQPEIRDITGGFQRRIRLVPFEAVIQQHQMVPELGRKLAGPGVLRWLAEGAKAWIDRPRVPPSQRIERASSEYISEQHQMKRWKEDMTLRTDPTDKAAWETSTDLYATYIFWCKQNGIRFVETLQALINYLVNEEGFVRTIRTDGGTRKRGIAGIKIIQAPPMDTM